MEFSVSRNDLASAVTHAVHGVPTNPVPPVRAGMRIETRGNDVLVSGSDGDVTFDASAPAKCVSDEIVTVPGRLFADVVRTFPDQEITFISDGDMAVVSYGRVQFKFPIYRETYPDLPDNARCHGEVDAEVFTDAVKKVLPACAKADPVLSGLRLEPDGDTLWLAGTDRYGLAAVQVPWTPHGASEAALVPSWAAERFSRGAEGTVALGWDDRVVTLASLGLQVTSRLLQGEYPKWRKLLPPEPCTVEVPTLGLLDALRRARLASDQDDPVELAFSSGQLRVQAGLGNHADDLLDAEYDGNPFTALFGIGRLADGLGGCGDTACFGFTDPLKPVYIQSGAYSFTILPRRRI